MKVLHTAQPRRRVTNPHIDDDRVDQSMKNACDINIIMLQYAKTGMLPHFPKKTEQYIDNTQFPPFLEAFETVQKARDLFYELPAPIRLLMSNDPSQLDMFIADPNNQPILLQYGVMTPKKPKAEPETTLKDVVAALKSKNSQESTNQDSKKS